MVKGLFLHFLFLHFFFFFSFAPSWVLRGSGEFFLGEARSDIYKLDMNFRIQLLEGRGNKGQQEGQGGEAGVGLVCLDYSLLQRNSY